MDLAVVSAERSDVVPGKMGFICGSDNKVLSVSDMSVEKMASMYGKGLDKSRVPSGSNSCEVFQTAQFG